MCNYYQEMHDRYLSYYIYEMSLYVSFPTLTTSRYFYMCAVALFYFSLLALFLASSYLQESVFHLLFVPLESHKSTQFLAFLLRPLQMVVLES